MKEQIKILFRKVENELNPSGFKENEKITPFRFFSFVFSKRGQQRIGRLILKSFSVFGRIITGQQIISPSYEKWRKKYLRNKPPTNKLKQEIASWSAPPPLISVIMPVFNPDITHLSEAIESVKNQIYTNWELCISDDCSRKEVKTFLESIQAEYPQIKVFFREKNGNISRNMNSAVELAKGEYISFLDQDDMLTEDALFFVAKKIIEKRSEIIYSDEDKINEQGSFFEPHFKPSWSPHSLLSRNYINHFLTLRKQLFDKIGGFNSAFDGAQDHDLLLRATEVTSKIEHIPEILYHWRLHHESTSENPESKEWAFTSGTNAVKKAIERKGFVAEVEALKNAPGNYMPQIKVKDSPKVSIIIPTKDKSDILRTCLKSIFGKSTWKNYEVIIIDNNSSEAEVFELFEEFKKKYPETFRVEKYPLDFNFSAIMNFGAKKSKGDYLLLLNNDTEIITEDWIEKMLSFAQLPNVGAVGSKLLFPNGRLQHVGVVLGIRGIVGHVYVGSDGNNRGYFQSNKVITNYSAVTAACLMIKKDRFTLVGGFDEALAVEYNDVDFCLKLYERGFFNLFLPEVTLIHYESYSRGHPASTKAGNKRHLREAHYFFSRWKHLIEDDPFYNKNLSRQYTEFQYDV